MPVSLNIGIQSCTMPLPNNTSPTSKETIPLFTINNFLEWVTLPLLSELSSQMLDPEPMLHLLPTTVSDTVLWLSTILLMTIFGLFDARLEIVMSGMLPKTLILKPQVVMEATSVLTSQ